MRWKYWSSDDLADQWLWPGETAIDISVLRSAAAAAEPTFPLVPPSVQVPAKERADVSVDPLSDDVHAELQQAASLMRLSQVRTDPLFAGVNGHGTAVVIIDTGADLHHPAFGPDFDHNGIADRILFQYDFVGGNDPDATDGNGHGTHVAGIIGSQDATYTGMAPGTNFIILRVLNDQGSGSLADIEEAFQWVVAHRTDYNIVAVSMSIGDSQNVNSDQNNQLSNEVATLWSSGIATVVAAGNSYATYNTPGVNGLAATPFAWGVASTLDNANTFSSFSQRSNTMTEIAAPGSNITSSYLNDGWATLSGTSMATPMVSGLVALSQDLSEEITGGLMLAPATILSIMRSTGVNITDGTTTVPRVDALNLLNGIVSYYEQSSAGADTIYGWRGNDILSGLGGNDIIRGNLGDDTIDGGTGIDTAVFSGARAAYTLSMLGSNSVRVSGPDGNDTLSNVEWLKFADATVSSAPHRSDLDGDNHGDILWQGTDGMPAVWLMDGLAERTGAAYANPGASWKMLDSGDFNGDGKADILWQNADGLPGIWLMDGLTRIGAGAAGATNPGPNVKVVGTADFDGDGKSDILWQAADGRTAIWLIDGLAEKAGDLVGGNVAPAWHALGAADFTGDGKADILFQNVDGTLKIGAMDGLTMLSATLIGTNLGAAWKMVGAGDFNGDSKTDILWQNADGTPQIWLMDGLVKTGSALEPNPGADWKIIGASDVNGDAKADILWQNTDGTPAVWLMDGYTEIAGAVTQNPGPPWHIVHQLHDVI